MLGNILMQNKQAILLESWYTHLKSRIVQPPFTKRIQFGSSDLHSLLVPVGCDKNSEISIAY